MFGRGFEGVPEASESVAVIRSIFEEVHLWFDYAMAVLSLKCKGHHCLNNGEALRGSRATGFRQAGGMTNTCFSFISCRVRLACKHCREQRCARSRIPPKRMQQTSRTHHPISHVSAITCLPSACAPNADISAACRSLAALKCVVLDRPMHFHCLFVACLHQSMRSPSACGLCQSTDARLRQRHPCDRLRQC